MGNWVARPTRRLTQGRPRAVEATGKDVQGEWGTISVMKFARLRVEVGLVGGDCGGEKAGSKGESMPGCAARRTDRDGRGWGVLA